MKKNTKVITVIASIMIVSGILLTAVGYFSGAKLTISKDGNGFKVLDSGKQISESFSLDAFTSIEGNLEDVDFEILSSSEYKLEITRTDNQTFTHEIKDNTLYINEKSSGSKGPIIDINIDLFNSTQSVIKIYVPKDTVLSAVNLVSQYGDVRMNGLTSTKLMINANDGDVVLKGIHSDLLTITNSYGDINAEDLQGEQTKFTTNDGDIDLKNIDSSNLQVSNQYGDMSGQSLVTEQLNIVLSDGDLKLNTIDTNKAVITNQYGDMLLSQFDSQALDVQNDSGDVTLEGTLLGTSRVHADYGDIQLSLNNERLELNFSIQNKSGDIKINNEQFEGSVIQTADSNNQLNITASDGNIDLNF